MKVRNKIIAITPFICIISFLLLGFLGDLWHPGWIVFLLIPFMPIIVGKKNIRINASLFISIIYLILGIGFGLWHPWWVIFFLIPVINILFGNKDIVVFKRKKDNQDYYEDDEE